MQKILYFCKYKEYGTLHQRRQDIEGFFYDDGNVYVVSVELLKARDSFGKKMGRMETDREQNIEIDDEFDFWLAEQVLKKRLKEGRQ